jgi:hypothetical protein
MGWGNTGMGEIGMGEIGMGEIGMDETDSHWFGCCVFDAEQPICQGNNSRGRAW